MGNEFGWRKLSRIVKVCVWVCEGVRWRKKNMCVYVCVCYSAMLAL